MRDTETTKYPWCMVFVQWCFGQAGIPLPYKSASCKWTLDWWQRKHPAQVVVNPEPGDIVIYNFGHTGIVESVGRGTITAIEGNTSFDAVGSQSNGGAVARKTRNLAVCQKFIRPLWPAEEETEMTYQKLEDIPLAYRATIKKLIDRGIILGNSGGLDLTRNMCRFALYIDRAGLWDL